MTAGVVARSRLSSVYVGAVGVATVAYMFGPGVLQSGPVFNAIGASAIVAVLAGVAINRPRPRLPWILFACGQALFVGGDIIAYNWTRFFGGELPYPSAADALYLLVYPCLLVGLLVLIHERNPTRDRASLLDALIVATGVGVLSWAFLISPYAHDATLSLGTKLVSIAYPVADLLLLGVVLRLAMGAGRRGVAFNLLVCGAGALLVTDALFGWRLLHGGYETGGALDPGWIGFYALWGAAALHPSMRTLSEVAPEADRVLTRRRLGLLAGAALIAPTVLIVRLLEAHWSDAALIAGSSLVLFALVVARMAGLVRDNEQTTQREKALREAGAALVAATGREGIYTAALAAAGALAGDTTGSCLYIAGGEVEGELEIVAAAGGCTARPSLCVDTLPADVREGLLARRGCALDDEAAAGKRRGWPTTGA